MGVPRWSAAVGVVTTMALVAPREVQAHLRLLASDPAPSARLAGSPAQLRLSFSVVPQRSLSAILLLSAAGDTVPLAPLTAPPSQPATLEAALRRPLPPGTYIVVWRAASGDGHPISGTFTFSIAGDLPAGEHDEHARRGHASSPPVLPQAGGGDTLLSATNVAARAASSAALFTLLGAIFFRFFVLSRLWRWQNGKRAAGALWRARRLALGACGILLVAHLTRLILEAQLLLADASGRVEPGRLLDALSSTRWGLSWLMGLAALLLALIGLAGTGGRPRLGWYAAAAGTLLLAVTAAAGGHAASERLAVAAVGLTTLHIVSGGGWLGTLLMVLVAGVPAALYDGRGDAPHEGVAELMLAFSPVALVFSGVTFASGAVTSLFYLPHVSALLDSAYGNTLLLKLALVALVAGLGFFHWRRALPRLGSEAGTRGILRSARAELLLAGAVIALSALLVMTAKP